MSGKLAATLCTVALLGAGIYGGTLLGDQLSAEVSSVTQTATSTVDTGVGQTAEASAPAGKSVDRSPVSGSKETTTEIYNRIIAERQTDEILAERDFLNSGVLPDIEDGARFDSLAAHHSEIAKITDPRDVTDNEWLTWDVAAPGMALRVSRSAGGNGACTLGYVGERDGNYYGLTAGHCMEGSGADIQWKEAHSPSMSPFGKFLAGQTRERTMTDNAAFSTDYAVIGIESSVPGDMAIAKKYTVVDVVEPNEITVGMEICKLGYRTEETCGEVMASNDSMVRVNLFSLAGDSGAPAYVKLGDDKVAAVGMLSGSPEVGGATNDNLTDFALMSPILRHTGMTLTPYL